MNKTQFIVYLTSAGALLMLYLLGDTYLDFLLLGTISLLLLFLNRETSSTFSPAQLAIVTIFTLFVFFTFISACFTHSSSLSLRYLYRVLFVYGTVLTVSQLRFKKFTPVLIVSSLLLATYVLTILAAFFWSFPQFALYLPGMNLIYSSYGHNHLSAVLLLFIPISWWWYFKNPSKWVLLATFWLHLWQVLSLGRVALMVGFLQFMAISWINSEKVSRKIKLGITGIYLIIGLIMTASFSGVFLKLELCQVFGPYFKICDKVVEKQPRWQYWGQALQALQEYPSWGYGPGTFSLINKKYKQHPLISTSYAHNAYLQVLAESGWLVGSFFVLLVVVCVYFSVQHLRKTPLHVFSLEKALLVGFVGMSFNVLFDFDWDFISLFALSFVWPMLILTAQPRKYKVMIFSKIRVGVLWLLVAGAGLFLMVDVLTRLGKTQAAFHIFPYIHSHSLIFAKDTAIPKEKIAQIYYFHPDVIRLLAEAESNPVQRHQLYQHLYELEPWQLIYSQNWESLAKSSNSSLAIAEIVQLLEFAQQNPLGEFPYLFSYFEGEKLIKMASYVLSIADQAYEKHDFARSGEYYLLAHKIHPWILQQHQPVFLQNRTEPENLFDFFKPLGEISVPYYGDYADNYIDLFKSILPLLVAHQEFEFINTKVADIAQQGPWKKAEIWEGVSEAYEGKLLSTAENDKEQIKVILMSWSIDKENLLHGKFILDMKYIRKLDHWLSSY